MAKEIELITQGIPGSFHFEACYKYFADQNIHINQTASFLDLAEGLISDSTIDYGVMAIENSIAGSIIQNYKILREHRFRIVGELYLEVHHNLLLFPGSQLEDIKEVRSHPMALNQCLGYLKKHPHIKLVSTGDTASSAKFIQENQRSDISAIASAYAAELYGLEIAAARIQASKINYTRFVIIQPDDKEIPEGTFNKASIYIRTLHKKGSLLKVLQKIYDADINLSKLQSYPVEDNLNQYYFYLDLEFDDPVQYEKVIVELEKVTQRLEVLGVYERG